MAVLFIKVFLVKLLDVLVVLIKLPVSFFLSSQRLLWWEKEVT